MHKKQLLAFLLTLVLLVSSAPIQAQAAPKKSAGTSVKKLTLSKTQYVLKKGEKLKLKASVKPAKAKLSWKSSNKKVATVNAKGVVKAKAAKGKATITVKAGKKKATCKITIGTPVKKIKASDLQLAVGQSTKIKASVTPKKVAVRTLTYKSNNSKIARVNKQGKVTAVKEGTAKITITAADRGKVKKVIKVTVGSASTSGNNTPAPTNTPAPIPDTPQIHDNTEQDIQDLNDGKAVILRYPDTKEVSFINGAYTDYKVTDEETALASLGAVESILNVKDTEIAVMPVRVDEADNGDTYYTYQQMQSIIPVTDAFLKIGVDQDGNTICLSSSIDPEAANFELDEEDIEILAQNLEFAFEVAEEIGKLAGYSLLDQEPSLEIYNSNVCWVFYLQQNNEGEVDSESETQYLKLYINAATCALVDEILVASIDVDSEGYDNDVYFDVETEMMTFEDSFGRTVDLPVAKEGDKYSFVDTERKIFCFDTEKSFYGDPNGVEFVRYYFDGPEDISSIYVTVFENMRKMYDFYKEQGIESLDGHGLPLAVGLGMDQDRDGEQDINACCMGKIMGFGCFQFSDTPVSIALDTAAHEFGHGVRNLYNCAGPYLNDTGAIEESYADIFGNLIEMQIDPEGADCDNWYIGETSQALDGGFILRSMANPHEFAQPEYIGDVYYVMNSIYEYFTWDDNGGVHTNSSVLAHACYQMSQAGINNEDNLDIWKYTLNTLTPASRFKEAAEMVRFSMERQGFTDKVDAVNKIFDAGKLEQDTTSWDSYEKPEGTAEVKVAATNMPDGYKWSVRVYDEDDNRTDVTCDKTGIAKTFAYLQDKNIEVQIWITTAEGEDLKYTLYEGPLTEDLEIPFDIDDWLAEQQDAA